jgi:cell shape-determining protein MreD
MSSFLFIPVLYLVAVLQTWFASRWDAFGVGPNLLVLIGFLWLTQSGSRRGLLVAALAGLVSDLNAPTPLGLGLGVALFSGMAYGVIELRRRISLDGFPAQLGVVWFAAASITLWQGVFFKFFGHAPVAWSGLMQRSALVGLYTMCVAIPILIFVFWRRTPRLQFG